VVGSAKIFCDCLPRLQLCSGYICRTLLRGPSWRCHRGSRWTIVLHASVIGRWLTSDTSVPFVSPVSFRLLAVFISSLDHSSLQLEVVCMDVPHFPPESFMPNNPSHYVTVVIFLCNNVVGKKSEGVTTSVLCFWHDMSLVRSILLTFARWHQHVQRKLFYKVGSKQVQ